MATILAKSSKLHAIISKSKFYIRPISRPFSEETGSQDDKDLVPEKKDKENQKSTKKSLDLLLKLTDPVKAAVDKAEREERARKAKEKLAALLADVAVMPPKDPQEPPVPHTRPAENAIKKLKENLETEKLLGYDVKAAVDKVSSSLPEPEQSRSELLSRLMGLAKEVQGVKTKTSVNDILVGIKIDQKKHSPTSQRYHTKELTPLPRSSNIRLGKKTNLFRGKPLNIFKPQASATKPSVVLDTWRLLSHHEKELVGVAPPKNAFEELISWTEKGILWKFPIDNEQGLEEEVNVGFDEHIFLEPVIDEGFPKSGPVREFMELVAIGLSKNPHISVSRKHEHIQWFREFFADKEQLLQAAATAEL